jgi:hypothetical protein
MGISVLAALTLGTFKLRNQDFLLPIPAVAVAVAGALAANHHQLTNPPYLLPPFISSICLYVHTTGLEDGEAGGGGGWGTEKRPVSGVLNKF